MRKLIIHAGLHKTATTTIQRTFKNNLENLKNFNLTYPVYSYRDQRGQDPNHSAIIRTMFIKNYQPLLSDFEKKINSTTGDWLIVAEAVSSLPKDALINLKSYFESRGFIIEVHLYIRPLVSWINSFTCQKVYGLRSQRYTIAETVNELLERGIIKWRIEAIEDLFDNLKVHKFTDAIAHPGGPAGHFLNELNISIPTLSSTKYNSAGSDCLVRLVNLINQFVGNRTQSEANEKFHLKLYRDFPKLLSPVGEKFHLRMSEVADLLPMINNENNWLKDRFGDGFYERELKFSNELFTITPDDRNFIIDNFKDSTEPVKSIVEEYLKKY